MDGGIIKKTSVKAKGVSATKRCRLGATEIITEDFINVIMKGHPVRVLDNLDCAETISWTKLKPGMVIYFFKDLPSMTATAVLNLMDLTLTTYTVQYVYATAESMHIRLQGDNKSYTYFICLDGDVVLNHMVSKTNVLLRLLTYEKLSEHRIWTMGLGLFDWNTLISFDKPERFKGAALDSMRKYGILEGKTLRIPYTTLNQKRTELYDILKTKEMLFPDDYYKQSSIMAFWRRYPVDFRYDGLLKDYFGNNTRTNGAALVLQPNTQSHLKVKSYIDEAFFSEGTKLLVHTLIEKYMFKTPDVPKDVNVDTLVQNIVRMIRDVKTRFIGILTQANSIRNIFFCNMPPEMNKFSSIYTYMPENDVSNYPLKTLIDLKCVQLDKTIEDEFTYLKTLLIDVKYTLEFTDIGVFTETTLGILPILIAQQLNIKPQVNLRSNNTADFQLIRFTQSIFKMTMMLHNKYGLDFPIHVIPVTSIIREPPPKVHEIALKTWLQMIKGQIDAPEQSLTVHCVGCLAFWQAAAPFSNFIADTYRREGNWYIRKQNKICI